MKEKEVVVIISPKEKKEREAPTCVGGAIPCKQEIKKQTGTTSCDIQTGAGFLHSKMQIKSHRRIIPIINIIKTNKPSKSRHVRQRIFFILANYFKGKQGKS